MEEKSPEERQLAKVEEISLEKMSLEQKRQLERLYHQLGLDPVVNKVLKEFTGSLSGFSRVTDKMFGPYDIKGRAEAVAKVTAFVAYATLSEQYNKQVGNLESQITNLEGEREKVTTNYDKLVEKVAEIVGGDYDELKTNFDELVERLAEVEHLRSQIEILNKERAQLTERYESQITAIKDGHAEEVGSLRSQITERDSRIKGLESEKATLSDELETSHETLTRDHDQLITAHETLTRDYDRLKTAVATVSGLIPYEEIRKKLVEELYAFLLKDSKVPDMVLDGVGRFIDFRKYLGMAIERGATEAVKRAEEILDKTASYQQAT